MPLNPNLLTLNQAGFETNTSGIADYSSNIFTRTTVNPRTGAGALLVEIASPGGLDFYWTYDPPDPILWQTTAPVTPGVCYTASLWVRAETVPRFAAIRLEFINAARNGQIGYWDGFRANGNGNSTVPGAYVEFKIDSLVAPPGAAYVLLHYLANGGGGDPELDIGEQQRFDDVYLGECCTPPANDDAADAAIISGNSGSIAGTTECATLEPDEIPVGMETHSVWYRWVAPVLGLAVLDVVPSIANTFWSVRLNPTPSTHGWLVDHYGNNQGPMGGTWMSALTFEVLPGEEYWIQLSSVDELDFEFSWAICPYPPNDDLANAEILVGNSGLVSGTTICASPETNEPEDGIWVNQTVWYQWTAPNDGQFALSMTSTGTRLVTIYEGTAYPLTFLEEWAPSLTGGQATFPTIAGTTYSFQVSGQPGSEDIDFDLSWSLISSSTVWYEWTAPRKSGTLSLSLDSQGMTIDVFTGTELSSLILIDSEVSSIGSTLNLHVDAGKIYWFRVRDGGI